MSSNLVGLVWLYFLIPNFSFLIDVESFLE